MEPRAQIDHLLEIQEGVIARRQVLEAGLSSAFVARRVRRRDWSVVHPGVYVDHTGPLTWRQRAWAAVLSCWPAGLDGRSALRAYDGPGQRGISDSDPIELLVDHRRRVRPPPGVRVRRVRRFPDTIRWNLAPPRLRYDDAVLALADVATGADSVGILADAVGSRRTTASRLLERLAEIPWLHQRAWLTSVLTDIADGTCSALEHAYLTQVERPHGLPRGLRQVDDLDERGRRRFRDVRYGGERPRWTLWVELDGRTHHSSVRQRDADLERDLDAALDGEPTVRLGWSQVVDRSCATAAKLARVLAAQGWRGTPHPCPTCPPGLDWGLDWGRVTQEWGTEHQAG